MAHTVSCPNCRTKFTAWEPITLPFGEETPFARGIRQSQASANAKWSADQIDAVDKAIATCAQLYTEFTADHVWTLLGAGFPVSKGMAGRLIAAQNAGLITNTHRTLVSGRGGDHCHGQRLTVWAPA